MAHSATDQALAAQPELTGRGVGPIRAIWERCHPVLRDKRSEPDAARPVALAVHRVDQEQLSDPLAFGGEQRATSSARSPPNE